MQGKRYKGRRFFRVFKANLKLIILGLFFVIGIFLGSVIMGQVLRNEKLYLGAAGYEEEGLARLTQETQEQTYSQNDYGLKSSNDSFVEPISDIMGKRVTLLLAGVDRRPGEMSFSNTDTLLVASINTENGKVALLSIPRDTQVTIIGNGKSKINAAAREGQGLESTQALVETLIGQPIDGYVLTDFSGFKKIIDTLGGITVTVEKNMHYVTGDKTDGVINLTKGTQRLNGSQALQYARFRQDALADISRTTRQQAVLKAVGKEFLQVRTIPKLPWIIPQIHKSVETNLSISQMWTLMNILLRFEKPVIITQTLPGNFLIENDISYWKVDPQKSLVVVKRLFEEGKTTSMFFKEQTSR